MKDLFQWLGASFVATWLLLDFAYPVRAQQHPNLERGLSPDQAFAASEIDDVNLFNGQLTINVPLGHAYNVGAELEYSLNLTYSSKVWDWETVCDTSQAPPSSFCQHQPSAGEDFNAGLGWTFHLGRLKPPTGQGRDPSTTQWPYIGPDGAEHVFHDALHLGETPVAGVFYTRDNTYLRQKIVGAERTVEFPDGEIHTFRSDGLLREIRDRFGNFMRVSISANGLTWNLEDGKGGAISRRHTIKFVNLMMDGQITKFVKAVQLAAFGGRTKTYSFDYQQVSVERPCPFDARAGVPGIPAMSPVAQVQLLRSVTLPDGSNYWMPPKNGGYYLSHSQDCWATGAIRKLALPTKGEIEWTYTPYEFPPGTALERPPGSGPLIDFDWLLQSPGVSTRRIRSSGGTSGGTWRYTPSDTATRGVTNSSGLKPVELRREVVSPAGDRTIHYFATWAPVEAGADARRWEHGLPFSLLRTKVQDGVTLHRSMAMYKGSSSNVPERTVWLRYSHDGRSTSSVLQGLNRRIRFERTDYRGGTWTSTRSEDFDGFGHYRHIVTKGNLNPTAGSERRDVVQTWNGGAGSFELDQQTGLPTAEHSFRMLPPSRPWVLTTYDRITSTEGSSSQERTFCFDTNTGFLKRTRAHISSEQRRVGDVINVFTPDSRGNISIERNFRATPASSGPLCSAGLGQWDYRVTYTYAHGTRSSSQFWMNASTPMPFKSQDFSIDRNTGLPSSSRDFSGIQTNIIHDTSGRVTELRPSAGHGAWVKYVYSRATSINNPPRLRIQKRPNGATSGPVLQDLEIVFDGYSRVWKERERLPSGAFSLQETRYNAIGWVTRRSEKGLESLAGSQRHWTTYSNFDAFGRAGQEIPPDGAQNAVSFVYNGIRSVRRTEKVRTSGNAFTINQSSATYIQEFDRYGRMWRVTEPSGGLVATYQYDVAGRLVKATVVGNGTQVRQFSYDGRGFLNGERHPEKSSAQNGGWINYGNHDARGNAKRKTDGGLSLDLAFDGAERLTQIKVAGGRVIKSFAYSSGNSGNNRSRGKLRRATRHNRGQAPGLPPGNFITTSVSEEYEYRGRGGLPSRRVTTIGGVQFAQSWAYDDLGNITRIGYPRCTHAECVQSGAGPVRNLAYSYSNGVLRSVSGFVDFVGYHANGATASISHTNGTVNTFVADAHGLPRPRDVRLTLGNGTNIGFGDHKYDGAGNLVVRGPDFFLYDANSRLTRYSFGSGDRQDYSYDSFGNIHRVLTSRDGRVETRSLAINSAKNRLSAAGYDSRGNLTSWGGVSYTWDEVNQLHQRSRIGNLNERWETYIYNANDERVATIRLFAGVVSETWTLRGLGDEVLRVYVKPNASKNAWSWVNDYIHHTDGTLLASARGDTFPNRRLHFATDHLGTPLIGTDENGDVATTDSFFGFGEQFAPSGQLQRRRFTGHERDHSVHGRPFDLDYMHARHYSPHFCRFLSMDPAQESARLGVPQSWNRYSYARGNPMMRRDPDGRIDRRTDSDKAILEDPDVLAGIATMMDMSGINLPLSRRVEVAAVIVKDGKRFRVDGFQTDNMLKSVTIVTSRRSIGGPEIGRNTRKEVATTIHTHPGTGRVKLADGSITTLAGGVASPPDRKAAAKFGAPQFIINADKSVVKVQPTGPKKAKSISVLTGTDAEAFFARANQARARAVIEVFRAFRF